jgi:hypothetical protein
MHLINFILPFACASLCYLNQEGVITHAPDRHWYALKERFRHAQVGRASSAVFQVKLPVSSGQQPKPQICILLCVFSVSFFIRANVFYALAKN